MKDSFYVEHFKNKLEQLDQISVTSVADLDQKDQDLR
jgi:hypothetical protein